jgi:cellulose synthase/poly-beta-1,6-N-acetylglucosamine synthase-like glycosyltransferase
MNWLLALAAISFGIQTIYCLFIWRGWRRALGFSPPETESEEPISVIVAARNEEKTVRSLLRTLSVQNHSQFEVILVDDESSDATARIVEEFAREDERICLIAAPQSRGPRKKSALSAGIATANYEILAFTDADCLPPENWLRTLNRYHVATGGALLVGYSPFLPEKGFLNKLARYENVRTGLLTAAACGLGRPYMAVGRNLSYRKTLFQRVGGFDGSSEFQSGDDDLFLQTVSESDLASVVFVGDCDAFVPSTAPKNLGTWLLQKRRHTSASRGYRTSVKGHLALFHGTSILVWVLAVLAGPAAYAILATHLILQLFLVHNACTSFRQQTLLPWSPVLELAYTCYLLVAGVMSLLPLPRGWITR